jgi:phosphoserine phosphatase
MGGIIAVIFDFDDTLMPDSTTQLLRQRGIDGARFWQDAAERVKAGYDETLSWLNLFLELIGAGKPLGMLTNHELGAFGATLEHQFFPGIPRLFTDLRKIAEKGKDVSIEFYIISGGLKPILEATKVVTRYFSGVYASELGDDGKGGVLTHIKRAVTFTEKTRYLFEINKGVNAVKGANGVPEPQLVNKDVPIPQRRVPIKNMIYVGDGLTDIPCFSVVGKGIAADREPGTVFGIYDPKREETAKRAYREFLKARRVDGIYSAKYGPSADLGQLLRLAVGTLAGRLRIGPMEVHSAETR